MFPGTKWSTKSIRSHFTVKKRDVLKSELEKAVPASMAESVKAELQRVASLKRTTDGEGESSEKKRSLPKINQAEPYRSNCIDIYACLSISQSQVYWQS